MSKKVAQVIIEALKDAGVEHCYGIVGDTLNAFASGLAPAGIKFIHMRHEEAGAFAAQGEALLLNRLTAVAGSCGPGSLHFHQWPVRSESKPRARDTDRKPGGPTGAWL